MTRFNFALTLVFLLVYQVVGGYPPPVASAQGHISLAEIERVFADGDEDEVLQTLNDIVPQLWNPGDQGAAHFLRDVWARRVDKYPQLSWRVLDKDVPRLRIANVLLLADLFGNISLDRKEIHEFSQEKAKSANLKISLEAIHNLAYFDDLEDVEILSSIAKKEDPETYSSAVISLSLIGNKYAEDALDILGSTTLDTTLKKHLIEIREKIRSIGDDDSELSPRD